MKIRFIHFFVILCLCATLVFAKMPVEKYYTNSLGMKFVRIKPGTFTMGQIKKPLSSEILPVFRGRGLFDALNNGDYDERPVHQVKITKPFYIGVYEVTNYQYELFRHEHKKYRGKKGLSEKNNEAATYVNWYDAVSFCKWLSQQEGLPYRLPTEAEWEYACRAGTETNFNMDDTLPESFVKKVKPVRGGPKEGTLTVGQTPPNKWGIYDMHGNLEEWCYDWYGPYKQGLSTDPVGYKSGEFRVTRGGSDGSDIYFMRSANRLGAIPETRNWVTGFRVVIGHLPDTEPLPAIVPLNQKDVVQRRAEEVSEGPDPDKPYFKGPRRFVIFERCDNGPIYACHNHDPAIVECPNGDLIAIWYTCHDEHGRELALAGSRLRYRSDQWQPASLFFYVPDRNNHAPALWFDEKNNDIFHFSGVSAAKSRSRSVVAMRKSYDSGATWSGPRIIVQGFERDHLPSEPVIRMDDGTIAFTIDGPNTVWMSKDEGLTWYNPGGDIPGIHSGLVQLNDGRLFALSRGYAVEGKMPISISDDGGMSFTLKASPFPTVGGGQRLGLLKLRTGELVLASFTNEKGRGIWIKDSSGQKREIRGLFTAVSEDDGKTWPYRRLVTDDNPAQVIECTDGAAIAMSGRNAEYRGYLSICQGLDGVVHLISSRNHYSFNRKWLKTTPPPVTDEPIRVKKMVETFDGPDDFELDWHDYKGPCGDFNGKGQYTLRSNSHYNGFNILVGSGSFEATFSVKNIHFNPQGPRIAEGVTIGFRDSMSAQSETMFVFVKKNEINPRFDKPIKLSSPPEEINLKFIYTEEDRRWRMFYGLNGDEAYTEFPASRKGFYWKEPSSESCSAYYLMSNGSVDLDHFEIKPL